MNEPQIPKPPEILQPKKVEIKPKMPVMKVVVGFSVLFLIGVIYFSLTGESVDQPIQQQTQQQKQSQPTKTQIPAEPQLLGKWFGKRNIYLAKEDLKYVATFDPPLPEKSLIIPPTSSDPIYPYLVGLLNEVWGLLPSQLSNPQVTSSLVFYENYTSGEKFPFLLLKDETTGAIFGVSFWKE